MQRIRDIYAENLGVVNVLVISTDPSEDAGLIQKFKNTFGLPWPMAVANREIQQAFRVLSQSSEIVIDRDGVIVFRGGYGQEGEDTWKKIFAEFSAS